MLAVLVAIVAVSAALLGATAASAQETVTIPAGDFYFCAPSYEGGVCETTISAGDTVVWDFSPSRSVHTTTECGTSCDAPTGAPLWNSGFLDSGTFSYTFAQPGTYLYFCRVHPALQRGRIVVQSAPLQPTEPGGTPGPTATLIAGGPTSSTETSLPRTGQGPDASGSSWPLLALGVSGAIAAGASAFAYARGRRIE
ncbi:MAG: hypothetical protein WEB04_00345 [Dehalococcoidia bacterium]